MNLVANKTYGVSTIVTLENAEFLVPFLEKQLPKDIIAKMDMEGLIPLSAPSTKVESVFVEDEETGKVYEAKKIMCWCYY